jgi:hypothetical protein
MLNYYEDNRMKDIVSKIELVAYCGLYCGACRSYLKDRCPGCHDNKKASWCKVRICCIEHNYSSCADCKDFSNPSECKNYNNVISKIVGFVLRSDRAACVMQIKQMGIRGHADTMTMQKKQTIKKGSAQQANPPDPLSSGR